MTRQEEIDRDMAAAARGPLTCDFCCAQPAGLWVFPVGEFTLVEVIDGKKISMGVKSAAGSWGACDVCAAHLHRAEIDALVLRAVPTSTGQAEMLCAVYRSVVEHRTGPPRYETVRPGQAAVGSKERAL